MIVNTHCATRLGDNLAALHFVRGLAKANPKTNFVHRCSAQYLWQLGDLTADLPNVALGDLAKAASNPASPWYLHTPRQDFDSVNLWKNTEDWFSRNEHKCDYARIMLSFFAGVAEKLGMQTPLCTPRDLLFDYPALKPEKPPCAPFDFLIVNSPPMSNQFEGYNSGEFTEIIAMLARKFHVVTTHPCGLKVTCTQDAKLSVTQIGQLSQHCRAIIMVSTGPSWPTFNIWNLDTVKLRVILIDEERVELTPNTVHLDRVSKVRDVLMAKGFL